MPRRTDISSILTAAAGAVLLVGCAEARDGAAEVSDDPGAETRATLQRIAQECGLPTNSLGLRAGGDIYVRPPADASYESVDCALTRLRENGLTRNMPMGFVGNEAPATENSN